VKRFGEFVGAETAARDDEEFVKLGERAGRALRISKMG
jgi:hypothetical protein